MAKATRHAPISRPTSGNKAPEPRMLLHRDQLQDKSDPYIPREHYADGTVCSECGAVYERQRWTFDPDRGALMVSAGVAHTVVCPGCRIIEAHDPQGVVTLSGDYWPQHREDILNLIHNEAERGKAVNPLERIVDLREEAGSLVVETTTEKLAQRIGRSVGRAHKGTLEYQWPDRNQLVRVNWERQLKA